MKIIYAFAAITFFLNPLFCMEKEIENKKIYADLARKIEAESSLKARCIAFYANYCVTNKKESKQFFNDEKLKKLPAGLPELIKTLESSLTKFNDNPWNELNDPSGKPLVADPTLVEAFLVLTSKTKKFDSHVQHLIQYSCTENSLHCLHYFFDHHNLDINKNDNVGETALYWAVFDGNFEAVNFLLHHGAKSNISNSFPVHTACDPIWHEGSKKNKPWSKIVKRFIENGDDCNVLDNCNRTPLDYAKDNDIKELLLNHCALTAAQVKAQLKEKTKEWELQLLAYAAVGNVEGMKGLLDQGTNVNAQDESGNTPLMLAARNGYIETVKELLVYRDTNKLFTNRYNQTAYTLAIEAGHTEIAAILEPRNLLPETHYLGFYW